MSNSTAVVVVSVVLSAAVSFAVTTLMKPAPVVASDNSLSLAELKKELAEMGERTRNLTAELERVRSTPVVAPDRQQVATVSDEQVAASVSRWFAERGGAKAMEAAGLKDHPAVTAKFDAKVTWQELKGSNAWEPDKNAAWKKVHESGHMAELLQYFEEQAKVNAAVPQAHLDLAGAYISAMQFDQSQWQLSAKADGCYDKVLEMDANNWDARFSKAISYSFWPDALGKKGEAISHFERLVEQQKTMPVEADQAQTYLYLGNLLEQRGEKEKARTVWQQGLQRHPDSKELRGRTGG